MPAIDQCEPNVIRALQKEGWRVTSQPTTIKTGGRDSRFVYADLALQHTIDHLQIIVVEVKCFPGRVFYMG